MVLGRIPGTRLYRVIACSAGPATREACSRELEDEVGQELAFSPGDERAKLVRVVETRTGDGGKTRAFELDRAAASIATYPAGGVKLELEVATLERKDIDRLKQGQRAFSPLARYATGWSFSAKTFRVDLDGDRAPDRVALCQIEDRGPKGSRVLHGVWVALAGKPFELVDRPLEPMEAFGSVDLDADGRQEILLFMAGPGANAYDYALRRVVPGAPLPLDKLTPSAAWQAFDQLEDHDHSDE
jgi:hypothetical protein